MSIDRKALLLPASWVWLLVVSPTATGGSSSGEVTGSADPASTNPTGLHVQPRQDQSRDQQQLDQLDCYLATCEDLQWEPYEAYDELVADGHAVALTRTQQEQGLITAAMRGAVNGAVAGEILGDAGRGEVRGSAEKGAEIGVAISLARYLIRAGYLREPQTGAERRVVSHFERELRAWERAYTHCLRQRGYRVSDT